MRIVIKRTDRRLESCNCSFIHQLKSRVPRIRNDQHQRSEQALVLALKRVSSFNHPSLCDINDYKRLDIGDNGQLPIDSFGHAYCSSLRSTFLSLVLLGHLS